MKVQIYDTHGNDYGEYGETKNVDFVETYLPTMIEGLANEHGVRITTFCKNPIIEEEIEEKIFTLILRAPEPDGEKVA